MRMGKVPGIIRVKEKCGGARKSYIGSHGEKTPENKREERKRKDAAGQEQKEVCLKTIAKEREKQKEQKG